MPKVVRSYRRLLRCGAFTLGHFSLVGAILYLSVLGYNMSIAVWVGMITIVGTAAETSAVMLAYLDEACNRRKEAGGLRTLQDLIETVHSGAVERIRPMAMIGLVDVVGLFPVMWATGTGADVMKRIAAPQVGGVFSAMILTLFVIPPIYVMWRWWKERKENQLRGGGGDSPRCASEELAMGLAREHYIPALRFGWLTARLEGWLAPPSGADDSGLARFCRENHFLITHACRELVHCQVFVITPGAKDRTQ